MNTRQFLLGLFLIVFITVPLIYYVSIYNPPDQVDQSGQKKVFADVNASMSISQTTLYRGENYHADLQVSSNTSITLNNVTIILHDDVYNRTGSQTINLNQTMPQGSTNFSLTLSPAFPGNGGAVIAVPGGSYQLTSFKLVYNTTQQGEVEDTLLVDLSVKDAPVYNQANTFNWEINQTNANVEASGGNITITSTQDSQFALTTMINATGYPLIQMQENKTQPFDVVQYYVDSDFIFNFNGNLSIGNYLGMHAFNISGFISAGQTIHLNMTMLTKSVVLFAVIADNNFAAPSGENLKFRDPGFYVTQMSYQFQITFNITFIPAVSVNVPSPTSTDLSQFAQQTMDNVGTTLGLDQTAWQLGSGTFAQNDGYDVLLMFTNDTMDHLGVVYSNGSGAFNFGIVARGTQYTGNYRLPPSFADNLIQHEVSHIFGAPDRFTSSSPPSIMTKSDASDAVRDIVTGIFWLLQIKWLELDIQTMNLVNRSLYWNNPLL